MSMFFFKICCLAYAIMAAYMVSQSPYDHACKTIDEDISEYMALTGPLNITLPLEKLKRRFMTINNFSADQGYKFCNQFLIPRGRLPGVQSEDGRWDWMNPTQETLTKIFGWTAVVVAAAVLFSALKFFYNYFIHPLFCKHFEKIYEIDEKEAFNEVIEITAYVPQVKIPGFSFPFLICDDADLNKDHIGWNMPEGDDYDSQNLIYDVKAILEKREGEKKNSTQKDKKVKHETIIKCFSSVKSFVARGKDWQSTKNTSDSANV